MAVPVRGQFKIEKGVPELPFQRSKYPFADMTPGDSFLIPVPEAAHRHAVQAKAGAACRAWGGRNGGKYVSRQVDGGVRIWRIE